jgi:hypothetical protein
MRKLTLIAAVAAALIYAPAALGASSPTVSASAPTGIGQTAATLHGTVKANGLATTYQFEYGPTTALGSKSPATAAIRVNFRIRTSRSGPLIGGLVLCLS